MDRNRDSDDDYQHEYYSTAELGDEEWLSPTVRHGDFEQADWDMRFLSALTKHLSARPWDTGVYEIERLTWADSIMTLVVRVWGRDNSVLVGWCEHLPRCEEDSDPTIQNRSPEPGTPASSILAICPSRIRPVPTGSTGSAQDDRPILTTYRLVGGKRPLPCSRCLVDPEARTSRFGPLPGGDDATHSVCGPNGSTWERGLCTRPRAGTHSSAASAFGTRRSLRVEPRPPIACCC